MTKIYKIKQYKIKVKVKNLKFLFMEIKMQKIKSCIAIMKLKIHCKNLKSQIIPQKQKIPLKSKKF